MVIVFAGLGANAYIGDQLSRNIAGYQIVFRNFNWKGEDGVIFQVFRKGHKLLERRAHSLFLFDVEKQRESYDSKENTQVKCVDLTGDGIVDLIVQEWSGGAYCCYKYDIYSLGKSFKHIWHHDAVFGHLEINDVYKKPRLVIEDTAFCNFNSMAQCAGAKPKVHLVWRNGFVVDRAATITAARKISEEIAKPDQADNKPESEAGSKKFVYLIYSGQTTKALLMLDGLSAQQKRDYLSGFFTTLKKSPFYNEIVFMSQKNALFRMEKLAK